MLLPQKQGRFWMKRAIFYGWIIVAAAFVTSLLGYGVEHAFSVFLKPISSYYEWSRAATAGAFIAFTIGRGIYGISLGFLVDRYGPRLVVVLGALFMAIGMMLSSTISEPWHLYLIYAVFIAGGVAAAWIPLAAAIAKWFGSKLGTALGVVNAGAGVGIIIVPPLAGVLISFQDVRFAYLEVGGLALVLGLAAAYVFRGSPEEMGLKPYDYRPGPSGSGSATGSGAGVLRSARSMTVGEAIHTRAFWIFSIVIFMYVFDLFTVLVNLVSHATDLGVSPLTAPTIMSFMGGFFILGALMVGTLGERFGYMKLFVLLIVLQGTTSLWLTAISTYALFCLAGALIGLSYGGSRVLMAWVTADYFGPKAMGTIFGSVVAVGLCGGALGSFMGNILYERLEPHSYTLSFWIAGGMQLAGAILFLFLKNPRAVSK